MDLDIPIVESCEAAALVSLMVVRAERYPRQFEIAAVFSAAPVRDGNPTAIRMLLHFLHATKTSTEQETDALPLMNPAHGLAEEWTNSYHLDLRG